MNTNEQAPECCPFCGAAMMSHGGNLMRSADGEYARYKCGNAFDVQNKFSRGYQSEACANAERERLTRERDDLATRATALAVQVDELARELEAHAHDLSPAMVQARNDQLAEENAKLRARVKRLEEAGDFMAYNENVDFDELVAAWEKAKEATP